MPLFGWGKKNKTDSKRNKQSNFNKRELQRLRVRFDALADEQSGLMSRMAFVQQPEVVTYPFATRLFEKYARWPGDEQAKESADAAAPIPLPDDDAATATEQRSALSSTGDNIRNTNTNTLPGPDGLALRPSRATGGTAARSVGEDGEALEPFVAGQAGTQLPAEMHVRRDKNERGIDFDAYATILSQLSSRAAAQEKIQLMFSIYEDNDDGILSRDEFHNFTRTLFGHRVPASTLTAVGDAMFDTTARVRKRAAGTSGSSGRRRRRNRDTDDEGDLAIGADAAVEDSDPTRAEDDDGDRGVEPATQVHRSQLGSMLGAIDLHQRTTVHY